jgi:hypothetical protein
MKDSFVDFVKNGRLKIGGGLAHFNVYILILSPWCIQTVEVLHVVIA